MKKVKRIVLECTYTYQTSFNTGIQRVVHNILKNSFKISGELDIKCLPVISTAIGFISVNHTRKKRSIHWIIMDFLKKVYKKTSKILTTLLPFLKDKEPLLLVHFKLWLLKTVNTALIILLYPVTAIRHSRDRVVPEEGDILLLLDSSWGYPIWPAVRKFKKNGGVVGLVFYDMIPITHPLLFEPLVTERFRRWLEKSIENVDFYIAISETTRKQISSYIKEACPDGGKTPQCDSFPLGSVIEMVDKHGLIREELRAIFTESQNNNVFLAIGTIEPRKNHKYLLDSFEILWRKYPDIRLCILGRIGWSCERIIQRIRSHKQYGRSLFMFNDCSDTELDYAYSRSKALITPSVIEGFGLPIIEALFYRLPVLASNIPIYREVGKDFCSYFNLNDPSILSDIIINIEETGEMPEVQASEEYPFNTWEGSCRKLLNKSIALSMKQS